MHVNVFSSQTTPLHDKLQVSFFASVMTPAAPATPCSPVGPTAPCAPARPPSPTAPVAPAIPAIHSSRQVEWFHF